MKFMQEWGLTAGIAGIALSVILFVFTAILRKPILSLLTKKQAYVVILSIITSIFLISVICIILYYQDTVRQVTVLVHSDTGKDILVLPNRGKVELIYGDASIIETINVKGEATFKQIPPKYFKDKERVEIHFFDPLGEPYRVENPDSLYRLSKNRYISLAVKLYGLNEISGVVKDFETGDPIPNVRVSIRETSVLSNHYGEYELSIPEENQHKFQTVRAYKDGYEYFEQNDIPIQTDSDFPILMKPKRK